MTVLTEQKISQANQRVLRRSLLLVLAMFGFGFAMVPLYDVFCSITGLNGKTGNKPVLQHVITATAVNLVRIGEWWNGIPVAPTRISRFGALKPSALAA